MLPELTIRIDNARLKQVERTLSGIAQGAETAIMRGINRSLNGLRTDAVREVFAELALPRQEIFKTFAVQQAKRKYLLGKVFSTGGRIPLFKFPHDAGLIGAIGKHAFAKGVKVGVWRQGDKSFYQSAFVAQMKSGHRGIFWRAKKGDGLAPRLPIKELYGPSIPDFLGNESLMQRLEKQAMARFYKNLDQQVKYLTAKGKV